MADPSQLPPIEQGTFWLPKQASNLASEVDFGWNVAMWVSVIFFFLVVIPVIYFAIRYRRRKESELPPTPGHNTPLEIFWTVTPLAVFSAAAPCDAALRRSAVTLGSSCHVPGSVRLQCTDEVTPEFSPPSPSAAVAAAVGAGWPQ